MPGPPRSPRPPATLAATALVAGAVSGLLAGGIGFVLAWRLQPRPQSNLSVETIVVEIRRIARLATVEAHEAQILRIDDRVPFLYVFESRKNALLLARGRVLAGVDLEHATIDVHEAARRIDVRLPPARVLAVEPEVEFVSEESGFVNPITPEDRTAWLKLAAAELRRAALAHGVRERATENARRLVEGFALGLGYTVRFTGDPPAPDQTPAPRADR